jgi:cytochrome c5
MTRTQEVVRVNVSKLIMGGLTALSLTVTSAASAQSDMSHEAIAERLEPVGKLCMAGEDCGTTATASTNASSGSDSSGGELDGAAIYGQVCAACHDTGAAGAPKKGDVEAWAPRLEKGSETLYSHAINGFNAMPAKGANPSLSDDEVKAAVDHLVATSK